LPAESPFSALHWVQKMFERVGFNAYRGVAKRHIRPHPKRPGQGNFPKGPQLSAAGF
jgi:hypothetical protein